MQDFISPLPHRSVSFDTELSPTWAAVTPIMHQPTTWVLLTLTLTLEHHQSSSVLFAFTATRTHTHPSAVTPIHSAKGNREQDTRLNLFICLCWDWISFQKSRHKWEGSSWNRAVYSLCSLLFQLSALHLTHGDQLVFKLCRKSFLTPYYWIALNRIQPCAK